MCVVVAAAIIIVNCLLCVVGAQDEIIRNGAIERQHGGRAVSAGGDVWLTIPRVNWTVIPTLSHCIQKQVADDTITPSHSIIQIDMRPWSVHEHVVLHRGVPRQCLEHSTRLFLPETIFAYHIPCNQGVMWLQSRPGVWAHAHACRQSFGAVGIESSTGLPPQGNGRRPQPAEGWIGDGCVAVISGDVHRDAVQTLEGAWGHGDELGSAHRDSPRVLQRPVTTRRQTCAHEESWLASPIGIYRYHLNWIWRMFYTFAYIYIIGIKCIITIGIKHVGPHRKGYYVLCWKRNVSVWPCGSM